MLAVEWLGTLLTLLPWGLLADRIGERRVLATGLAACGILLVAAGRTSSYPLFVLLLFLVGAAGASVSAASGRAVMGWFAAEERGLALGIRQTAIPAGGFAAALVLPQLDVAGAFAALGVFCLLGAAAGALFVREPRAVARLADEVEWTIRDRRLWVLCLGSGLYLVAQIALIGFVVLYLHDERGLGEGEAAAVLAAIQVVAAALRIAAGRWSDVLRLRVLPLRRIGLATAFALAVATALLDGPLAVLIPAFVVAGALSMAWNGLSFTVAAELAGRIRSGAAIGVQQSSLSAFGVAVPIAFAALVAATSWHAGYALAALCPVVGWWVLRPLADR